MFRRFIDGGNICREGAPQVHTGGIPGGGGGGGGGGSREPYDAHGDQ